MNSNKLLAELLGFNYDKEKNRSSPLKGSIPGSSSSTKNAQEPSTASTQVKGNMYSSRTIFMPSSICCLVSLQSDDQYFLASSMDGLASIGS